MEKVGMLLLALGLVTLATCTNLNQKIIRRKRAFPMEDARVSTQVANTSSEPGNFIVTLVKAPAVQVEYIHIVRQNLGARDSGYTGKWTQHKLEKLLELIKGTADREKVPRPMDCQEVQENGHTETGVYEVWPRSQGTDVRPVQVRCDMDTDGGGWTVIQRRGNFSKQEDFERDWKDYKKGFGDLIRDFWIGNDIIYALSNQGKYSARLDMMDVAGNTAYELYRKFWIDSENDNYTLHIDTPSGTAGDNMAYHNGQMFSTYDRDNDNYYGSCAKMRKCGFWWDGCVKNNPNGLYQPGVRYDPKCMHCSTWKTDIECLLEMEIKLKRL